MNVKLANKNSDLQVSEEDLASHLSNWPRSDATPTEFEQAFSLIASARTENSRLNLMWALWRRVDRLEVARPAVRFFASNLSWVHLSEAPQVAERFSVCFTLFPELAAVIDPAELSQKIRSSGSEPDTLYYFALGFLVAPRDGKSLEQLLLKLAEHCSYDVLESLFEQSSCYDFNNVFCSRLLRVIADSDGGREAIKSLAFIADRLDERTSLAKQRFGTLLARALLLDESRVDQLNALHFAEIAIHARRISHEVHQGSRVLSRAGCPDTLDVILRVQQKLLSFHERKVSATNREAPALESKDRRSGIISWFDFELSKGPAWIPASSFKTSYAELTPNGSLSANVHPPGGHFQFGPYIFLGAGRYSLVVYGSASPGINCQLRVSADCGARSIKMCEFETVNCTEKAILELVFDLDGPSDNVEFSLVVSRGYGSLSVSGVSLAKRIDKQ